MTCTAMDEMRWFFSFWFTMVQLMYVLNLRKICFPIYVSKDNFWEVTYRKFNENLTVALGKFIEACLFFLNNL